MGVPVASATVGLCGVPRLARSSATHRATRAPSIPNAVFAQKFIFWYNHSSFFQLKFFRLIPYSFA